MALADDIRTLRDRALSDLDAAHDYFTDTRVAWQVVLEAIDAGQTFSIQSRATGSRTTHVDLAARVQGYVAVQLAEATFQQFIAIFESFFFDLLRRWLMEYPKSLGAKKLDFQAVLDAPDKDAITLHVVNRELNEVLYDRPAGWFQYLESKVGLRCPTPDEIERLAEAKATRDVLVHNRGVATKTYESKAGRFARHTNGQRIDMPEPYHRETWDLIRKIVADVSNAAIGRVT